MKRPKGKGREVLTLSVVQTAQAGDAEAMNCILRYYACVLLGKHTVKRDDCFGGGQPASAGLLVLISMYSAILRNSSANLNLTLILPFS